jgi:hypothetical protein
MVNQTSIITQVKTAAAEPAAEGTTVVRIVTKSK